MTGAGELFSSPHPVTETRPSSPSKGRCGAGCAETHPDLNGLGYILQAVHQLASINVLGLTE
jgi:hypothetical protein